MAIFELFTKRQKMKNAIQDIYSYDQLPQTLRVQIVQIIDDVIGENFSLCEDSPSWIYQNVHRILCREFGCFSLGNSRIDKENIFNHILKCSNTSEVLDAVEACFIYIDASIQKNIAWYQHNYQTRSNPVESIEELNYRFREASVGYQLENLKIIRVDSMVLHQEIIKPTLALLWNPKFVGANDEYMKALDHYKNGRNKECLTECLKSFESVMKIICHENRWTYDEKDTSKRLIQICLQNNLIPSYMQSQLSSLQNIFESGIPTIRNRMGGHGQGQELREVDDDIARYALNLTGANILLFIERSKIH